MENLTLEPPTAERLLIFENLPEQQRILTEIENRRSILNSLASAGLSKEEITSVTSSLEAIDKYIFKKQLEENNALKELIDKGIKGVSVDLSPSLQSLNYNLRAWFNYRMPNKHEDKFSNLILDGENWKADSDAVEKQFIRSGLKFYIEGEQITEYRELEMTCDYFKKYNMPSNQIRESSFLWGRIEPAGSGIYKPRWQYFRNKIARS